MRGDLPHGPFEGVPERALAGLQGLPNQISGRTTSLCCVVDGISRLAALELSGETSAKGIVQTANSPDLEPRRGVESRSRYENP
jgi:hypothetical protein